MRPLPSMTRKLFSASGLALATAIAAQAPVARAQSFNGSVAGTFGNVAVTTGTNTTTVTVSSPSAVINWTPNDTAATGGPIDFQSAGTTATFTNDSASTGNFVVLNRIIPSGSTRPIQFNGSIISQLQAPPASPTPGGTVFFYSPGGIIVGSQAVFDVGNLVLTTSDLAFTAGGAFNSGSDYVFQQASVAGAQVAVQPGAQITASVDGSYLAMIAPSVINGGTVSVNGSTALVAADAATIRFATSGLFDIAVDSGTSATGNVVTNTGTITGPAANAALGNSHRIYMVAVPKNDAITMAIAGGSSLGFAVAGAANVVGNKIVLSAGQNVIAGEVDVPPSAGGGTGLVSVFGSDANITSNFEARATGGVNLGAFSPIGLQFASDVSLSGDGAASGLFADGGGVLTVAGNVNIANSVTGTLAGTSVTGQSASISATSGGTITIGGNAALVSIVSGANATTPGTTAGSAVGGDLRIDAFDGGQISITGNVSLTSAAFGGAIATTDATAGSATGGNGSITAFGTPGSSVSIGGTATFSLDGMGAIGGGCSTCIPASGAGTGGNAVIAASGANSISISGATLINANGQSGQALVGSAAPATGGTVNINSSAGANISLDALTVFASATSGFGVTATGDALGGSINLTTMGTGGGGMTVSGLVNLTANGNGSSASAGSGAGATSTGGRIYVDARDGTTLQFDNALFAQAIGSGGITAAGSVAGIGGETTLEATTGGTLTVALQTALTASGNAGVNTAPNNGSAGTGGLAQVMSSAGGIIQLSSDLLISANGRGSNVSGDGLAGNGIGGTARISAVSGGNVTVTGTADLAATGGGGSASSGTLYAGGSGTGGSASVELSGATATFNSTLAIDAFGVGGMGGTTSGIGTGGNATINLLDSTLNANSTVYLGSIGAGGNTAVSGTGGNGVGGTSRVTLANSSFAVLDGLTLESSGSGGLGAGAATSAASGTGGLATVSVNAGTLAVSNAILLISDGTGANGVVFGDGGNGTGGTVNLIANGDSRGLSNVTAATYLLRANGNGGQGDGSNAASNITSGAPGSAAGNAQGGNILVVAAADGGTIAGGTLNANANAFGGTGGDGFSNISAGGRGGNGGIGGSAQGGTITFDSFKGMGTGSGAMTFTTISTEASGTGGAGGGGGFAVTRGDGGNGGSGTGGTVNITLDRGGSNLSTGFLGASAVGRGGSGGDCDFGCTASGGIANGGSVFIGSNGLTTGNLLSATSQIFLTAGAYGGSAIGSTGGSATAGNVTLRTHSGLSLQATALSLDSISQGGDSAGTGPAGAAQGGNVQLVASGTGTAIISNDVFIASTANGGNGFGDTTVAGAGTGGFAAIYSDGGVIGIGGSAIIDSSGFGGAGNRDIPSGAGGVGTGGSALLRVGRQNAIGNGGSVSVTGLTSLVGDGIGGDGWVAGGGIGGEAVVYARQGTITLDSVEATAAGAGGFGVLGGAGGAATGGGINIIAENAVEGPSLLTFSQLTADSRAFGGFGSDAISAGAPGGIGGAAQGGSVVVAGGAGNGVLQAGTVFATASASGGNGGLGAGASGGDGGAASAGSIQIGLISGIDTGSLNAGSANYGSIQALAIAIGGEGGATDLANLNATGGNGGSASGGGATLLVRGAPVTVTGLSTFDASATGGAGGQGAAAAGIGGNASIGSTDPLLVAGAYTLVTNRFNQPAQRGTLTAADLQFIAIANGGAGSTAGTGTILGGATRLTMINSGLTTDNISFLAQAGGQAPGALPNAISLTNSTATIAGSLSLFSSSDVSLTLDQSNLTGGQIAISGTNWVLDPVAPAIVGTIEGITSLSLSSGLDLVAYANVRSQGSLSLAALGRIDLGSLFATGFIDVTAGSTLTLDDVVSSTDSIDLSALNSITTGNLTAATGVTVDASGNIGIGNIVAGTGAPSASGLGTVAITATGNVSTGTITASSDLGIAALGTITTGAATAYDMLLLGGGNIASAGLTATNRVLIADASLAALGQTATGFDKELVFGASPVTATAGAITLGGPVTATAFRAATQSTFTSGTIDVVPSTTGSGLLQIGAGGAIVTTNLLAASDLTLTSATSIQAGGVTSQTGSTSFTAPTINVGAVQSATTVSLTGQTITTGNLTATGVTIDASGSVGTGNIVAGTGAPSASGLGTVAITATGNVSTGTITASSDLGIAALGTISTGAATAYDMLLLGAGNISSAGLTATNRVLIADASLAALGQTATGFDKELVFGANSVTGTAGAITLGGPVTATAFRAATQSTFTSGTIGVVPSTTASGLLQVNAGGAIVTTNLLAASDLTLTSATSIQAGGVTSQTGSTSFTAPIINVVAVQSATTVSLTGQTITTANLTATGPGGSVTGRASQTISTGAINAPGAISVIGADQVNVQSAVSTGGSIDASAGNVLNIGTVNGTSAVSLIAGTTTATGGLVPGQGRIAAGSVQGGGLVQIAAGGQVGTGNVRSTGDNVKIASLGSTVTTGAITALRDVLVSGAQGVTIGANINAREVILLSGGNVDTRNILAGGVFAPSPTSPTGVTLTNAIGRILIANTSSASDALLLSPASDFSALFLAPARLPGAVNLAGQIVAGQLVSYSQGAMSGVGIAAFGRIEVESGGLVTVGQRWGSPSITISSADIQIVDNGNVTGPTGQILSGLRTSATGEIDLVSLSTSPALIGDGLTGSGYSLSAAELGLVSTNKLVIGAIDMANNPVDMLIGNLAVTAGGAIGSTMVSDATGSIQFITGNRNTQTVSGGIRIVGNLSGSGFALSNIAEFDTGRFEIDAATGSLSLTQTGTALGGTVEIHADNIHVASGTILDRLAANPLYAGRVSDLNAPAAVQRPEGVLRALGLDLSPTGTLYIQNTGTVLDPAGFFADFEATTLNTAPNAAPASLSIIVNGKWQTTTGVVSGFAARDLVVQGSDLLSFFAPESTINGCAISASTCMPAVTMDPVPAISSQIQIVSNDTLGNTPTFAAEPEASGSPAAEAEQQDEPAEESQTPEEAASEADDAASPIAPPPQIIDSTPLEPQQQVEQPVAGSGNPSLIGSVVNETSAEGDAQ